MKPTMKERIDGFWDHVETQGECWIWTGHCDKSGRPQFKSPITYQAVQAQHFSLQLQGVPVPRGTHIRTTCGTTSCVRPTHLEVGGSLAPRKPPRKKTPLERAWKWIDKTDSCWLWTGGSAKHGYTTMAGSDSKTISVKKLIYEDGVGILENGKVPMPSKCGNTLCVNPEHMEIFDRTGPESYSKKSPEERFWRKVDKRGPDECWEWDAATRKIYGKKGGGYGVFDSKPAHRYSYELHYGPIPEGKIVCHRCNNPPCVNPAHLYAGTHAENSRDTWVSGLLHERGKKITDERADEILGEYLNNPNVGLDLIAMREGVPRRTLSRTLSSARERRGVE